MADGGGHSRYVKLTKDQAPLQEDITPGELNQPIEVPQDPTKLLVEHTAAALLRPAPPAGNAERFEQNEVVDAFYLDGWWPGVVMSVVGEKYRVGFRNPPDVLELERCRLRPHWDWDNGVWTRAPRKALKGSIYEPGTAVEVNLERYHLWYSWLPATFIGQLEGDSFLVQYRCKTPEIGVAKVVVADHQIRPRPPQQEETDFDLWQMVDAFYDMAWWVGDITGVPEPNKYIVTFKFTKEEKEFSHSDIRCHLEWVDKHWTVWTRFSRFHSTNDYGAQPRRACEISRNSMGKTRCNKSKKKQLNPCMNNLACGKTTGKLKISQHCSDDSRFLCPSPSKKLKGKDSEDTSSLPQCVIRGRKVTPQKLHDSNGDKIVRGDQEYIEDEAARDLHAGNTYLPPVKNHVKCGRISDDNEDVVRIGIIGKEKQAELLVQHSKHPAAGCMIDVPEKPAISHRLNQNLVTYQRKKRPHLTGVKHNATGVVTDVEVFKTNIVEHIGNPAGTVNQQKESPNFPFVKLSPLWEHFESMEAFKKFPQKPHFHPLAKMNDIFREGSAIGSMSSFASLVDNISNLQVDDPRESVERYLEGLVELELLGFDGKAIRHRLTELLDMKEKLGQLQNRSKEVKTMITRGTHDTTTYDDTITGIDKKIKDLQEERMLVVSMKEVKVSEVSQLQAEATAINEDIQRISDHKTLLPKSSTMIEMGTNLCGNSYDQDAGNRSIHISQITIY